MINTYQEIGGFGYATSYYLYGSEVEKNQAHIFNYEHNKMLGCQDVKYASKENVCLTDYDTVVQSNFGADQYGTLWLGNKVLDISGGALVDGSNIQLYENNGSNAQKWEIWNNDDGTITIVSMDEQLVMAYGEDGNVYLSTYREGDMSQRWWMEVVE